jgi:xanthosine utilization system XapX-like protein
LKKIARYARCFLAASIFCAVTFAAALILQPSNWKPYAVVALSAGLIVTFLFFTMNQRLTAARLIVENQILHIQPAVLRERDSIKESEAEFCETVEMFVSCFGILLGSKIIKFNQEGIQLKAVEIGRDYLSLDYGRDTDIRSIKLIHSRPDNPDLESIIEKFRYETGITPTITH